MANRATITPDAPIIAIGIDLAWQTTHQTGIAVLQFSGGMALLRSDPLCVQTNDQILEVLLPFAQTETLLIGIDAPLAVPNQTGRRPAEAQIAKSFGRFEAGAHPANRSLLARDGKIRGETLTEAMHRDHRISHTPILTARAPTRQSFEVYPHPAQVVLFGLEKTLKYKQRGAGRTRAERIMAFEAYRAGLRSLRDMEPALTLHDTQLMAIDPAKLLIKSNEDQLDAIMCAYIALYYWYWGTEKCYIFGDPTDDYASGYIIAPVDSRTDPRTLSTSM